MHLEGGAGPSDGLPEGRYLLHGLHPGILRGVMHLYRHPFGSALDSEELAERLYGDGAVHEHRPQGARSCGGQQFGVHGPREKPVKTNPAGNPATASLALLAISW